MPDFLEGVKPFDVVLLVVAVIGIVVAVVVGVIQWLTWLRDRARVEIRSTAELRPPGQGETGPARLELRIRVICRRGTPRVQGIAYQGKRGGVATRGKSHFGDTEYGITLVAGEDIEEFFQADEFARAYRSGAATDACWQDAQDEWHCERIPGDVVSKLLADADSGLPTPTSVS